VSLCLCIFVSLCMCVAKPKRSWKSSCNCLLLVIRVCISVCVRLCVSTKLAQPPMAANSCICARAFLSVCLCVSVPLHTHTYTHTHTPTPTPTSNPPSRHTHTHTHTSGYVNALAFANSGRFLVAGVGQEHRLGRWRRNPESKNGLAFFPLVGAKDT